MSMQNSLEELGIPQDSSTSISVPIQDSAEELMVTSAVNLVQSPAMGLRERRRSSIPPSSSSVRKEDLDYIYKSRASTTEFCRICHDLDTREGFISPCFCKGSLTFVHKSCLERWLAESDSNKCELCGFNFALERFPKYGMLLSVGAYLTSSATWRERRNLLVDLIALLVISPVVCLTTMMAIQLIESVFTEEDNHSSDKLPRNKRKELAVVEYDGNSLQIINFPPQSHYKVVGGILSNFGRMGIISLIATIDMAYISWITVKLQYHISSWYFWYRRNCKVKLVGYNQNGDEEAGPGLVEAPN